MQAGIWCGTKQVLSFLFSVLCCHQLIFAHFSYKPCTSPLWCFPSQIIKSLLSFVWFVSALLPLSATVKRQLIYCCLLLSLKTALIYPLKTYYPIVLHAIWYVFCLFVSTLPTFFFSCLYFSCERIFGQGLAFLDLITSQHLALEDSGSVDVIVTLISR